LFTMKGLFHNFVGRKIVGMTFAGNGAHIPRWDACPSDLTPLEEQFC